MFILLAQKSLLHRKGSVLLTILAMTVSILVILGVEHTKQQAKASFASSVSGVDLIVGSRTSQINLLLYSVFRIGSATANISWQSYQKIKQNPAVNWAVPIALGDSHQGYRVVGTSQSYFSHFRYGEKQALSFTKGQAFRKTFEVVLGAKVAENLGYQLGDKITLAHGLSSTSFTAHDEAPFTIVGILTPTGTPVDQSLHVSLQGLEAVHLPKKQLHQLMHKANTISNLQTPLTPTSVTAVMLGLESKLMVFNLQRQINHNSQEPLTAILPGVALSQLWQSMSIFEHSLQVISVLVFASSLLGLSAMLLASIKERSQELKLLRMIGASPHFIYWFIELEALLITIISALFAIGLLLVTLWLGKEYLVNQYGLTISLKVLSADAMQALLVILTLALVAAIPPALVAFKSAK